MFKTTHRCYINFAFVLFISMSLSHAQTVDLPDRKVSAIGAENTLIGICDALKHGSRTRGEKAFKFLLAEDITSFLPRTIPGLRCTERLISAFDKFYVQQLSHKDPDSVRESLIDALSSARWVVWRIVEAAALAEAEANGNFKNEADALLNHISKVPLTGHGPDLAREAQLALLIMGGANVLSSESLEALLERSSKVWGVANACYEQIWDRVPKHQGQRTLDGYYAWQPGDRNRSTTSVASPASDGLELQFPALRHSRNRFSDDHNYFLSLRHREVVTSPIEAFFRSALTHRILSSLIERAKAGSLAQLSCSGKNETPSDELILSFYTLIEGLPEGFARMVAIERMQVSKIALTDHKTPLTPPVAPHMSFNATGETYAGYCETRRFISIQNATMSSNTFGTTCSGGSGIPGWSFVQVNSYSVISMPTMPNLSRYNSFIRSQVRGGLTDGNIAKSSTNHESNFHYTLTGTADIPACVNIFVCSPTVDITHFQNQGRFPDSSRTARVFFNDPVTGSEIELTVNTNTIIDRTKGPVKIRIEMRGDGTHAQAHDYEDPPGWHSVVLDIAQPFAVLSPTDNLDSAIAHIRDSTARYRHSYLGSLQAGRITLAQNITQSLASRSLDFSARYKSGMIRTLLVNDLYLAPQTLEAFETRALDIARQNGLELYRERYLSAAQQRQAALIETLKNFPMSSTLAAIDAAIEGLLNNSNAAVRKQIELLAGAPSLINDDLTRDTLKNAVALLSNIKSESKTEVALALLDAKRNIADYVQKLKREIGLLAVEITFIE